MKKKIVFAGDEKKPRYGNNILPGDVTIKVQLSKTILQEKFNAE